MPSVISIYLYPNNPWFLVSDVFCEFLNPTTSTTVTGGRLLGNSTGTHPRSSYWCHNPPTSSLSPHLSVSVHSMGICPHPLDFLLGLFPRPFIASINKPCQPYFSAAFQVGSVFCISTTGHFLQVAIISPLLSGELPGEVSYTVHYQLTKNSTIRVINSHSCSKLSFNHTAMEGKLAAQPKRPSVACLYFLPQFCCCTTVFQLHGLVLPPSNTLEFWACPHGWVPVNLFFAVYMSMPKQPALTFQQERNLPVCLQNYFLIYFLHSIITFYLTPNKGSFCILFSWCRKRAKGYFIKLFSKLKAFTHVSERELEYFWHRQSMPPPFFYTQHSITTMRSY